MIEYHFRLIISGPFTQDISDEELLDVTDSLGQSGCNDCSISVHSDGLELEFDRAQQSLQEAITSAIQDVEKAGYHVMSIEMDRDAIIAVGSGTG